MHISNERYFRDRQRHDLALRMIQYEARTCTIRACTGLTDDRIRKLYRTVAEHLHSIPIRRRRGKSPRRVGYFTRNAEVQVEASLLLSVFKLFDLIRKERRGSLEFGQAFCDAYAMHRQQPHTGAISFEHAWFLLQLLCANEGVWATQCRRCQSTYLRDYENVSRRACPLCKIKGHDAVARTPVRRRPRACAVRGQEPCATVAPGSMFPCS